MRNSKGQFIKGHTPWSKGKKLPKLSNKNSIHWKGGRYISGGYVFIYMPEHPHSIGKFKRYIREHRYVVEQTIGRYLTDKEEIHHINENKLDNRPKNLYLFPSHETHYAYHTLLYNKILVEPITESNLT